MWIPRSLASFGRFGLSCIMQAGPAAIHRVGNGSYFVRIILDTHGTAMRLKQFSRC